MPTNALHSCFDVSEAQRLIAAKRAAGDTDVRVFVNEKNSEGQAPIHALMRQGPRAKAVIKYLITLAEVDINAMEDCNGVTIAYLCEDGDIMRYLVTQRVDFDPNIVNPYTDQTPLEYGVTYPKHPNLTEELLKCPRLTIDEEKIQALESQCTDPISVRSLQLIREAIVRRNEANTTGLPESKPPSKKTLCCKIF
jgi:hypothetical protein